MSIKNCTKYLVTNSERIKSLAFHPKKPLLAAALYDGTVQIYNIPTASLIRSINVSSDPQNKSALRCIRWMPSYEQIITSGDNLEIKTFDYNTGANIWTISKSHKDYVRGLAVHPTEPILLSCSDDNKVILYRLTPTSATQEQIYDAHSHFVMDVKFDPKDPQTFATASLDSTIKFWDIKYQKPRFALKGHESGVNCIEFCPSADRPLLASGGDDHSIMIWDYQTRSCIYVLKYHTDAVNSICYHPTLPILFSTSSDELLIAWDTQTNSTLSILSHGKQRGWTIAATSTLVATGYDTGIVVLSLPKSSALVELDRKNGKVFWTHNSEVEYGKVYSPGQDVTDGTPIDISSSSFIISSGYPTALLLSPSSKFVSICGESDFTIYSILGKKPRETGSAVSFAWAPDDSYAILKGYILTCVRYSKNKWEPYAHSPQLPEGATASRLYGGEFLGVQAKSYIDGRAVDQLYFFPWEESAQPLYVFDVNATGVWWSPRERRLAIASMESLSILRIPDDENEEEQTSMELDTQYDIHCKGGCWASTHGGDVFVFNDELKLYAGLGEERPIPLSNLPPGMKEPIAAGYLEKTQRIYIYDEKVEFTSYELPLEALEVLAIANYGGEANDIVEGVRALSEPWKTKTIQTLEQMKRYDLVMQLSDDPGKQFEMALLLKDYELAINLAHDQSQWQRLEAVAMKMNFDKPLQEKTELLRKILEGAKDESGMLLLSAAEGNVNGMKALQNAEEENVKFTALFAAGEYEKCIEMLEMKGRFAEAALMAKNYAPKIANREVKKWKQMLVDREKKGTLVMVEELDENSVDDNCNNVDDQQANDNVNNETDDILESHEEVKVKDSDKEDIDDILNELNDGADEKLFDE